MSLSKRFGNEEDFVPILCRGLAFEGFGDFCDFVKSITYGTSRTCKVRGSNPCRDRQGPPACRAGGPRRERSCRLRNCHPARIRPSRGCQASGEATVPRPLYMTASMVHCQSIVQVSSCQLVLNLLLPRYLEKWVSYKLEILVSK